MLRWIAWTALFLAGCRTAGNDSKVLTETNKPVQEAPASTIAEPYAKGESNGVSWQLRLNRAQCNHPPHPPTFCTDADRKRVLEEVGTENLILSWIADPEVKTIRLTSMSFSSSAIAKAFCAEIKKRAVDIELFLQVKEVTDKTVNPWLETFPCLAETGHPGVLKVSQRGGSWLNHGKVIMALTDTKARFTSASANFSASGLSLHYDNWLIMEADKNHPVALANICFFDSLKKMGLDDGRQDKSQFQKTQQACGKTEGDIRFIATPRPQRDQTPLDLLITEINAAKSTILIAAHRITDKSKKPFPLVDTLVAKAKEGVKIRVVFDDDTIIAEKKLPGFKTLRVNEEEIRGMRRLADAGADIHFIDTNEAAMALMHNKYMLIDGKVLFTGAGNFSLASLTGRNIEQFYLLRVPEILSAYEKGWNELYGWGFDEQHFTAGTQNESDQPKPGKPDEEAEPAPTEDPKADATN